MVIDPDCDKSELLGKSIKFVLSSSAQNKYKVPVKWNFVEDYLEPENPTGPVLKRNYDGSLFKDMSATTLLKSQLSKKAPPMIDIKGGLSYDMGIFELKTSDIVHKLPNLNFQGRASLFGQEKLTNVIFVQNVKFEKEFSFDDLTFKSKDARKESIKEAAKEIKRMKAMQENFKDVPNLFKMFTERINDLNKLVDATRKEPFCDFELPWWTSTFGYNKSEISNSRLYQDNYSIDVKLLGLDLTCKKKVDVTDYIIPLKETKETLGFLGIKFNVYGDITLSTGIDLNVISTIEMPSGDELDGPNELNVKDPKVGATLTAGIGVSINAELKTTVESCDNSLLKAFQSANLNESKTNSENKDVSVKGSAKVDIKVIGKFEIDSDTEPFEYTMSAEMQKVYLTFVGTAKICNKWTYKIDQPFLIFDKKKFFEYDSKKKN